MTSGLFKNKFTYKLFARKIWHWITHKGWYATKQPNQTKSFKSVQTNKLWLIYL